MPPVPNEHAFAVLVLTLIALLLFSREKIPLETSSLAVLALLTLGFEVFPFHDAAGTLHAIELFSGFGHEALIAVCALMIVGHGMVKTGALEPVGRSLARLWAKSPLLSLLATLLVAGALSAFVNNTPVVVLLLPILISVSLRTGKPASAILMPMGLATLVGGMATTIGTSTNLLVVSVAADLGLERMQMFDFLLPAVIAGSGGILYLWLVAPRILPVREAVLADTSPRVFTADLLIPEHSFADGRRLSEIIKQAGDDLRVQRVRRGESQLIPLPDIVIHAGDRLQIEDTPTRLKEYETALQASLFSGEDRVDEEHTLQASGQQLAEIIVVQGSPLVNNTLNRFRFYDRFQLLTLALRQVGRTAIQKNIGDKRLQIGDILLVQGAQEQFDAMRREGEMLVLDARADVPSTAKSGLALAIMGLVIVTAALGLVPIAISALVGVLLMQLSGVLMWRDVGNALSTQVILIVVVSLALGMALTRTGGSEYLAQAYLAMTAGMTPAVILSGLILLMAVLTNVVSNNAAAVIGTPVAISIANGLGQPAEAFVLAVLFGANMSYATPMSYKTNLLVMNAGNYTFGDFVRVGLPLTLIMWLLLSLILTSLYGL
jgi:di/tricarboxylate transporter